ncbi:MAG: patatin-like phospholipase family protein [Gallionella sp.]
MTPIRIFRTCIEDVELPSVSRWLVGLLLLLLVAGCAHYPVNTPLAHYDASAGYRLENLHDPDNSGSLLVVLTFSGGGTRAAALAYGVLEQLAQTEIVWEGRRKRLLDEIDIISAVSGGSYTAAYYALYRERMFTDFERDFLKRDFLKRDVQSEITRKILAPVNLIRTSGSTFGRIDLVGEYLDEELFHGATFGDLLRSGRRPFIIINASDMSLGTRFEFTQDQFDPLCSDLSPYLLAPAVAASSAVPIALSPLSLRNNAGTCDYREPEWVAAALTDRAASARRFYKASELRSYLDADKRPYIHLLDGGLSDNTGVRALLDRVPAEENSLRLAQALGAPALRKVVLIMVSAETQPDLSLDRVESVPTIFQVIRNVKDIPINRYSFETTELFKTHFDAWARRGREQGGDAQAIEFYLVEVTLEAIPDEQERQRFMRIPTSFYLPAEKVDALRQLAAGLLTDSPDYRRLLHDLGTNEGIDLRTEQVSPEAH